MKKIPEDVLKKACEPKPLDRPEVKETIERLAEQLAQLEERDRRMIRASISVGGSIERLRQMLEDAVIRIDPSPITAEEAERARFSFDYSEAGVHREPISIMYSDESDELPEPEFENDESVLCECEACKNSREIIHRDED